jgi:hypothetical protein
MAILNNPKADTSASQLFYYAETNWGETPSSSHKLTTLRYTGESLAHNKNTIQSDEIREDAQITDLIEVGVGGEGAVNFELSYGAYDTFLAALLRTDWVTFTSTAQAFVFDASGKTITGTGFDTAKLLAGTIIRVNGSADNDGFYTLASTATSTVITVLETLVNETAPGTTKIDTSYIRNGKQKKSFLLERQFTDLTSGHIHYMTGARLNTMSLNFTADAILAGNFGVMGSEMKVVSATTGDGSPTGATTADVMNATSNIGTINEGGAVLNNAIQSVTLEVTNNCRSQRSIGSRGAVGIGYGRFVVSGTMNMYFESGTLFEKMINHTASSWMAVVSDTPSDPTTGRSYAFSVPRLKFASGGPLAGAPDTDVMQNLEWTAMRDSVTGCTLQITRFPTPS